MAIQFMSSITKNPSKLLECSAFHLQDFATLLGRLLLYEYAKSFRQVSRTAVISILRNLDRADSYVIGEICSNQSFVSAAKDVIANASYGIEVTSLLWKIFAKSPTLVMLRGKQMRYLMNISFEKSCGLIRDAACEFLSRICNTSQPEYLLLIVDDGVINSCMNNVESASQDFKCNATVAIANCMFIADKGQVSAWIKHGFLRRAVRLLPEVDQFLGDRNSDHTTALVLRCLHHILTLCATHETLCRVVDLVEKAQGWPLIESLRLQNANILIQQLAQLVVNEQWKLTCVAIN
jgi:hypothetical protein